MSERLSSKKLSPHWSKKCLNLYFKQSKHRSQKIRKILSKVKVILSDSNELKLSTIYPYN